MILYIDTTNAEKMTIALGNGGKIVAKRSLKAKYRQAEKLLPAIDYLIKKIKFHNTSRKIQGKVQRNVDLSHILDEIVVVNGPGPFTATRIGVATANALGYGLQIAVSGIKNSEFKNIDELIKDGRDKTKKSNFKQNVVEPFYDKSPNITTKHKIL